MDCIRHRRRHHSDVGHLAVMIFVCVNCLLMAEMSTATYTRWCSQQDTIYNPHGTNRGYCGRRLSDEIHRMCRNTSYSGRSYWKRSTNFNRIPDSAADVFLARLMDPRGIESAEERSAEERSSQFLDGSDALAFLQYKRQSSQDGLVQNIICECCVNWCSNDELLSYCSQ